MDSTADGAGTSSPPEPELDQNSISELVRQLSERTSELARQEVELAKAELTEKGKRIGLGAGVLGTAGVVGLFAFGALTATLILVLATFVESWIAALIVAVVYAVSAGVLALSGKKQVDAGSPPVPERAVETTKIDLETVKQSAKEARHG